MPMRRLDRLDVIFVYVVPPAGLAVVAGAVLLYLHGPAFLTGNWVGLGLLVLAGIVAAGIVAFTQLGYQPTERFFFGLVYLMAACTALMIGMIVTSDWLLEMPLREHGRLTTCVVRDVKQTLLVLNTGESSDVSIRYENIVTCDEPHVKRVGTNEEVAEPGDRITAVYDLASRTPPRLAGDLGGWRTSWQLGVAMYGVGMLMRVWGALAPARQRAIAEDDVR